MPNRLRNKSPGSLDNKKTQSKIKHTVIRKWLFVSLKHFLTVRIFMYVFKSVFFYVVWYTTRTIVMLLRTCENCVNIDKCNVLRHNVNIYE